MSLIHVLIFAFLFVNALFLTGVVSLGPMTKVAVFVVDMHLLAFLTWWYDRALKALVSRPGAHPDGSASR